MTTDTREAPPLEDGRRPVSSAHPEGRRGHPVWALAAAVLIGVLGPLALSAWTGSLSIPHNDTWAFSRSAQIFADTGHVHLFNWNAMSLIGAFVPLAPVSSSIMGQQIAMSVLAVVGLAGAFDVLRSATGAGRRAAFGVLLLVCWPGFGLLSTSLMTDVPAFAACTLTLAFGRRAVERGSLPLFALCGLLGFWGFTVREQTIAAPMAVLGAALLRRELRTKAVFWTLGVIAVVFGGAAGVFELWRRALPGGSSPSFNAIAYPGPKIVIVVCIGGLLLLGLMLSPLVALTARPLAWGRGPRIAALVTLAVCVVGVVWYGADFPQNYFQIDGSYAQAFLNTRPDVVPQPVWDVLLPIACVSAPLLVGTVAERIRLVRPDLLIFFVLTLLGTLMEVVEGEILFDRYVFPLAIPLVALLLSPAPQRSGAGGPVSRRRVGLAAAAGVSLAALTGLLTANALAFDAATWRAAHDIVASGKASAQYVNAGLDWTGYYSPNGMLDQSDPNSLYGIYPKTAGLQDDQPCYVVSSSPQVVTAWTLVATPSYYKFGVPGPKDQLYVYQTFEVTCR